MPAVQAAPGLSARQKRLIAVAVVAGGAFAVREIRQLIRAAQREQKSLCAEAEAAGVRSSAAARRAASSRIAVDRRFLKRLMLILSICVPGPFSKEAGLILIQGFLLVSRTVLTDLISRVEGYSGSTLTTQQFDKFWRSIALFAAIGVPAALVNSALKYMQKCIELAFQERLTTHLHQMYCSNRAYYAASTLGGLSNADQRITEDVEKFAYAASELYSHTFKPLLDVVLFTRSLANTMGYKGQFGLYAYYLGVAMLLRATSPPLAQMAAQEAALSGTLRAAHQRLVTHAEEVAFNDPPGGAAEEMVLTQHLRRLVKYSGLSALQRGVQQVLDGYMVKYFASVVALLVYAAPIYLKAPGARATQGELTRDYIRSMRLLQNTSRGIGDLILVYKRVTGLASHTSRVAELMEQVQRLSGEDNEHKELFRRNVSTTHILGVTDEVGHDPLPPPRRLKGSYIGFHRVALDAPDGTPLIRELTFKVVPGCSVLLMGPNGCGKSSLFRVLAGLWPLQAGEMTTPSGHRHPDASASTSRTPSAALPTANSETEVRETTSVASTSGSASSAAAAPAARGGDDAAVLHGLMDAGVFYLSQRPYLVSGTLRDQLLYPFPPRSVWKGASPRERERFRRLAGGADPPAPGPELDAALARCLASVELEYLLGRSHGFDAVQPWQDVLSGGEKQRLAMARLLFHRPSFAVLDECTSAVSADGEVKLYQACLAAGITCLSIAHRPALKRFHQLVIHFDANVGKTGRGWWVEEMPPQQQQATNGTIAGGVQPTLATPIGTPARQNGPATGAQPALASAASAPPASLMVAAQQPETPTVSGKRSGVSGAGSLGGQQTAGDEEARANGPQQ